MASDFPIQYYTGTERGPMNMYFIPDATNGANIINGDLVFLAGDQEIEECGADPASILGIAKGAYADKFLWQDLANVGRLPVSVISPEVEYGLCVGAGTLAASHLGTAVGLQQLASGNWAVDLAEAVNTRVVIVRVDVTNQIAWVKFLAANLQFDAIAS